MMVKFLDTVGRDLDSSIKVLWLEGDLYDDKRFQEFAEKKGIYLVHINKKYLDTTKQRPFYSKEVKSFEVELVCNENPSWFSVNYGTVKDEFMYSLLGVEGDFFRWQFDIISGTFFQIKKKE